MEKKWIYLLVGYLVGSFFGVTSVLGMVGLSRSQAA